MKQIQFLAPTPELICFSDLESGIFQTFLGLICFIGRCSVSSAPLCETRVVISLAGLKPKGSSGKPWRPEDALSGQQQSSARRPRAQRHGRSGIHGLQSDQQQSGALDTAAAAGTDRGRWAGTGSGSRVSVQAPEPGVEGQGSRVKGQRQ